jgi:hypothetical protein
MVSKKQRKSLPSKFDNESVKSDNYIPFDKMETEDEDEEDDEIFDLALNENDDDEDEEDEELEKDELVSIWVSYGYYFLLLGMKKTNNVFMSKH